MSNIMWARAALGCARRCVRSVPAARPRWFGSAVGDAADDRLAVVMADVKRQLEARSVGAADYASNNPSEVPGVQTPGEKMVLGFTCSYAESPIAAGAPERTHRRIISKKSYETGVVLVRCDCCEKLHLIADNLGWFDDDTVNVETIMAERGEEVKRGVSEDGTVEFTD